MVHALERIHNLLRPEGMLINIQPTGVPRSLELHDDAGVTHVGWIGHRLSFELQKQAQKAVEEVIEDGLFMVESKRTFPFLYQADTFSELQEWLAENWENAILDEATVRRTNELLSERDGEVKVNIREDVLIMRLRSCDRNARYE